MSKWEYLLESDANTLSLIKKLSATPLDGDLAKRVWIAAKRSGHMVMGGNYRITEWSGRGEIQAKSLGPGADRYYNFSSWGDFLDRVGGRFSIPGLYEDQ